MKILKLLIGFPRSGKSTYAKMLKDERGYVIVEPDALRLAMYGQRWIKKMEPYIWAITYSMVEALFLVGHDKVVIDATNINEEARKPWFDRYNKEGYEVQLVIINTKKDVCIERAKLTGQEDLIPVIERMAVETDIPTLK